MPALWAAALLEAAVPHPDHVVIVIMENKSFGQIIGNPDAPNINALAGEGANIVNGGTDPNALTSGSHALRHPSQPNYLELFSGNNQGVLQDGRPGTSAEPQSPALPFNTPNLAASLIASGYSFATYSEGLQSIGFNGDNSTDLPGQNQYERKHNPAVNWQAADAPANNHLPPEINRPFSLFPQAPAGYAALPTVTFVVPDEQHNMHDGSIAQGDAWLKANILDGYYQWAKTHNSLLIVTFDEDASNTATNQITTIFAGALIKPGNYPETNINPPDARPPDGGIITPTGTAMNHYNVLRTVEEMFGVPPIGGSINTPPVTDIFRAANASMLNNSTRLRAGAGDDVLIGGFIVGGSTKKKVVVRGLGPSLKVNGAPIAGTLSDPMIELHRSDGAIVAANNNWKETQQSQLQAAGLAPIDDREAALVASLDPGNYTVVLSGAQNTTGIGLVEVYDVEQTSAARLLNLAARGRVQTQDNVMIGGVILGGADYSRIIFRGLGPSIPVAARLTDPALELHDGNGATIGANDDWKQSQSAEIQMSGLAPVDDREAAIIGNFPPGQYTVILRGKNGTSGIGLVEAYKLN
ncbi:MAG TPA: alkaline phosphatase family protein [Chthoniobacterales bacterium]